MEEKLVNNFLKMDETFKVELEDSQIYYDDDNSYNSNIPPALQWQYSGIDNIEVTGETSNASLLDASHLPETAIASNDKPKLGLLDGTFFKYIPSESTGSKIVAMCVRCPYNQGKVRGYNNCTSNFITHLKRKHGQECVDEYKMHMSKKRIERNISARAFKRQKILKNNGEEVNENVESINGSVVNFFINSLIPLRLVEDPYFVKMFSNLEFSNLIKRGQLCEEIENFYAKELSRVQRKIREVDYVCTALNVRSGFVSVTAHWIAHDLNRRNAGIACRKYNGDLSEELKKIYDEFCLDENKIISSMRVRDVDFMKELISIGVDTSNITKSGEIIQDDINSASGFLNFENEEFKVNMENISNINESQCCCVDVLTQCVTTDAINVLSDKESLLGKTHFMLMTKCNVLWSESDNPFMYNLRKPSATRWNSLFEALQYILDTRPKKYLTDTDFCYLNEFLTCTSPIKEALDILQKETNAYYGIILPCLLMLRKKIQKIEEVNNFTYCQPVIEAYRRSIETRFEKFFNLNTQESENAAIAALSYPRFKNKWLSCLQQADRDKTLIKFKTEISKLIIKRKAEKSTNEGPENAFFNFDSDLEHPEVFVDDRLEKAELLMLQFFVEESQEMDVLQKFPEIMRVFMKYNTPLSAFNDAAGVFPSVEAGGHFWKNSPGDLLEKRAILRCNLRWL